MNTASAVASRKDDTETKENEEKQSDTSAPKGMHISDIPNELLIKNIMPFIGDYQYRFVGLVNHAIHDAYVAAFPKKQTYYNTSVKTLAKISYFDSFRTTSVLALFPLVARKGDLEMLKYVNKVDKDYIKCFMMDDFDFDSTESDEPSDSEELMDKQCERDCEKRAPIDFQELAMRLERDFDPTQFMEQFEREMAAIELSDEERTYIENYFYDKVDAPPKPSANYDSDVDEEGDYFLDRLNRESSSALPGNTFKAAAAGGHLHILQWLRSPEIHWEWDEDTCAEAAAHGHLEVLKWCRANGCPWNNETCQNAAKHGHFEVLKWCHANGCPLDGSWDYGAPACTGAAENGHDEILKWLQAHGSPLHEKTCEALVVRGRLDLLKWCDEKGCRGGSWTCRIAAEHGHLDIVKWFHEKGCTLDEGICTVAAQNGHLDVLEYLREKSCPWDAETCAAAAGHGNLELLQWCRTNGCPWDKRTCTTAALHGHLELLQWCRENQCPWEKQTCAAAARNGHLEVLQWCRENGCPWDKATLIYAAENGHLEVIQWCRDTQSLKLCPEMCTAAAKNGHLEVIQWCRGNKCRWDAPEMCLAAAQNGHLHVLQWCHDNFCPIVKNFSMHAARFGHLDVVKWYHRHGVPCDEDIYVAAGMFAQFEVQRWCLHKDVGGEVSSAAIKHGVKLMGMIDLRAGEEIWLPW